MAYQKQTWRDYDDTKTELQNVNNGAVVTPERLNHMETGIANSVDKSTFEQNNLSLAQQLAQNAYISAKNIGLKSGEVTVAEAKENLLKLITKINEGFAITIDDVYYIDGTYTATEPIYLQGNKNGKLIIKSFARINFTQSLNVDGIEFDF